MINMRSKKVQTGLRLDPMLLERLKRKAKAENKTFNGYVEGLLEKALEPVFPRLRREDYLESDPELEALIRELSQMVLPPTQEELDADPRLAHIWGEG